MVEQAAHNRCVAGSSPVTATNRRYQSALRWTGSGTACADRVRNREGEASVAATDVRPKITLACEECKHRNYITKKNRRNDPDRLEIKKFCPNCRRHRAHKETR